MHRSVFLRVDRVFDAARSSLVMRPALPNPVGDIPAGVCCQVRFL